MEFDPTSTAFFEDPWDTYGWLRDERPVYHHERLGFWALSRFADCLEAHRDAATFSSTRGVPLDQLRSAAFGTRAGSAWPTGRATARRSRRAARC